MNKNVIIAGILIIALFVTGFAVFKVVTKPKAPVVTKTNEDSTIDDSLPQNESVSVEVVKSKEKENTVLVQISKLEKKYTSIAYEVTYETQGTFQGVNSGSKPIDVTGKEEFERDVYLGTCSKNVCKPHTGVKQVSVALEFTDADGNKSQFSKDFPL